MYGHSYKIQDLCFLKRFYGGENTPCFLVAAKKCRFYNGLYAPVFYDIQLTFITNRQQSDYPQTIKIMSFSWEKCVEELSQTIPEQDINRWLRTVQVEESGDTLRLFVPNEYTEDWIRGSCLDQIKSAYQNLNSPEVGNTAENTGNTRKVEVLIGCATTAGLPAHPEMTNHPALSEAVGHPGKYEAVRRGRHTVPFKTNLNARYIFDSLVQGPPNERAIAVAKSLADQSLDYNPLFIYGGVGLGKTHILHALGNQVLRNNPHARVAYRHAEQFVSEMVNAFRDAKIELFKKFYRSLDILLLDDVQMFIGKNQTQEEFFHTFNALVDGGKMLVLSSDKYPANLTGLQERLKSRFCSGLCQMIESPGLEMRVAILEKKADELTLQLPRDAAFFIASVMQTNVRELEGALNRLKVTSNFTNEDITIPFVKDTLSDIIGARRNTITVEAIQEAVARYYNIRVSDMRSKTRKRNIVTPRQIAMALAKDITLNSYPDIGMSFGGRDHSTVLHACRKVQKMLAENPEKDTEYRNIKATLQCGWTKE